MTDVSPGLYAAVKEAFEKKVAANSALQKYIKALNAGEIAEFKGAYDYTELLGTCLAGSFQEVLSSDVLPDGKMYFNIAKSVVEPFLAENYEAAVDAAAKVEEVLNKRANIGMKPIRPGVDQDKIDGIINRLSSEEHFDDVKWILGEPVVNLTQSGVDDTIRENVEFHARSGFTPTVTRISTRKCCEWCSRLAGRYEYPDVPKDVYRRHENCRCTVEYDPCDGKRQNVWSKRISAMQGPNTTLMINQDNTAEADNVSVYVRKAGAGRANGIFVNQREDLAKYSKNIKPEPGYKDFTCHSDENHFYIDMGGVGNDDDYVELPVSEFAEHIRSSKEFDGSPIRLISCRAGALDDGVAQRLANELGVAVKAATEDVNVAENGDIFVANSDILMDIWYNASDRSKVYEPGFWRVFYPRKEANV